MQLARALGPAIDHFREHGYAVIEGVATSEEMDAMGEAIRRLSVEIPGTKYRSGSHLLGRDPAIDIIATKPKILAFAEVSVGNGFRASQFDQGWIPAPFPEHNCVITFCTPADGMTDEEYMATAPEGMRSILGDGAFFGTGRAKGGVDMQKFTAATVRSKL